MNKFSRIIALIFALFATAASAQQMVGGEISYKFLSDNNYQVTVALYAKCPNPNLQPSIKLFYLSPSENSNVKIPPAIMNQVGSDETIAACFGQTSKCNGGTGEVSDVVIKRTYSTVLTLPRERQDWTLNILESRASLNGFVNTGSENMYLEAVINNLDAKGNSSPAFTSTPPLFSASNQATTYLPNTTDPDGDKLKYSLIKPSNAKGGVLTYSGSLNESKPISGSFTFDANTGKMVYTASKQGEMSSTVMKITETRGAKTIGFVMREFYFQTLSEQTSPPKFLTSDTISLCNEGTISIPVQGIGGQAGTPVEIIWNNKSDWPGAVETNIKGTTASFFLSTVAKSGFLDLTLIDNNCGKVRKSFYVKINQRPNASLNYSIPKSVSCIDSVKGMELKLTNPTTLNAAAFSYVWDDDKKSTTSSIKVFTARDYTVTVTDKKTGCRQSGTVYLRSDINFTFEKYCTDLTTVFYDVSGNPDKFNPAKVHTPLTTTKKWKWTFDDGVNKVVTDSIGKHKFTKAGFHEVVLEVSDGSSNTCVSRMKKNVYICGKPPVDFTVLAKCVRTERSSLLIQDAVKETTECTISPFKIEFFVKDKFQKQVAYTNVFGNRFPTSISLNEPGTYSVKLKATNDAGCSDSIVKEVVIKDKPLVTRSADDYYYRCDKGFPDTTFSFTATSAVSAVIPKVKFLRTGFIDDSLENVTSGGTFKTVYKIQQNHLAKGTLNDLNEVTFQIEDANGCTNDTTIAIYDPITPEIGLEKYYCFLNDNLKVNDLTFNTFNGYKWGLKSSLWDMKDGKTENTIGFADHIYTDKSLDTAIVTLMVEDVTGCKDTTTSTTSLKVYLSEPDTSLFQIKEPVACFADTVKIFGIKNKYINSWYYRYKNDSSAIYNSPELVVINTDFGKSFPSNLDAIKFYESNKYEATTGIFYNEPSTSLNFEKDVLGQLIVPLKPAKVCHTEVKRDWKIVERIHYTIDDTYNHCYDSLKVLNASLLKKPEFAVLDTTSMKWALYSPKNILLEEITQSKNASLVYTPSNSLFKDTATVTSRNPEVDFKYPPYNLKVKYSYFSEGITCSDSSNLKIANERIHAEINPAPAIFCLNYNKTLSLKNMKFLSLDEQDSTRWDYGNNTFPFVQDRQTQPGYKLPRKYLVTAYIKNRFGCKLETKFEFEVKPAPIAKLNIDSVCYGKMSLLNAHASEPVPGSKLTDFYWFFEGINYKNPNPAVPADTTEPDAGLAFVTKKDTLSKFFSSTQKVGLIVRDSNGCYAETKKDAIVHLNPTTGMIAKTVLGNDEDYLGNEPIKFTETKNDNIVTKWTWDMGDGVNKYSTKDVTFTYPYFAPPYPVEKNIYDVTLKVTTAGGCIDSVKKRIDVNVYFVLPNAFSPNEDGLHDQLLGIGKGIKEIKEFKIFNRWGEVIHSVTGKPEKDDSQRGYLLWDGKYKGEPQPVGAYVYYAVVKTGYGEELVFKGNLALLK